MNRCKILIVAVGVMVSAAVGAQEPAKTGTAAGTKTAGTAGTLLVPTEALVVGGAALVGTIIGLSDSADSISPTTASTSSTPMSGSR